MLFLKLKELRNKHKLTYEKVAEIINVSKSTYILYEGKNSQIKLSEMITLAKLYGVTLEYISQTGEEE